MVVFSKHHAPIQRYTETVVKSFDIRKISKYKGSPKCGNPGLLCLQGLAQDDCRNKILGLHACRPCCLRSHHLIKSTRTEVKKKTFYQAFKESYQGIVSGLMIALMRTIKQEGLQSALPVCYEMRCNWSPNDSLSGFPRI
jgi:hypothetical protein